MVHFVLSRCIVVKDVSVKERHFSDNLILSNCQHHVFCHKYLCHAYATHKYYVGYRAIVNVAASADISAIFSPCSWLLPTTIYRGNFLDRLQRILPFYSGPCINMIKKLVTILERVEYVDCLFKERMESAIADRHPMKSRFVVSSYFEQRIISAYLV